VRNEDDDDSFHHNWKKFIGIDNEKFDDYVTVDSHLVTIGVDTVEELCESRTCAFSLEGEDSEPEVVLSFADSCAALLEVKSFVSVHSR
jgi:hypothetical protein